MRSATLYRAYDASGAILYIGVTSNLAQRMRKHKAESRWYPLCAQVTTTGYASRSEADAAEGFAICDEDPPFNASGTWRCPPGCEGRRCRRVAEAEARRLRAIAAAREEEFAATEEQAGARGEGRAVDDPAKLAWAARIVTMALERGRLNLADLTPQGPGQ